MLKILAVDYALIWNSYGINVFEVCVIKKKFLEFIIMFGILKWRVCGKENAEETHVFNCMRFRLQVENDGKLFKFACLSKILQINYIFLNL